MIRRVVLGLISALVALAVGIAGGMAFAYWTTTGRGSGSAVASGGTHALTVQTVSSGTPSNALHPGGSADLVLEVRNDNASPVTITGIEQVGTITVAGGGACTAAGAAVEVPTSTALSIAVAGNTTATVRLPERCRWGSTRTMTAKGAGS